MTAEWPHDDVCWHVTSAVNRASIDEHGLDWCRMGPAGSQQVSPPRGRYRCVPEMPGVFLCGTWDDVEFFLAFGSHPLVEVWEVKIEGLVLEDEPDGWLLCRSAIPRSRIRLVRTDAPAPERPA